MDNAHLDAPTTAARTEAAADFREGKRTGKSFIGMPVISLADGERKGTVHDVVYSAREGRLLYFTVPVSGGFFGGGKTLLLDAVDIKSVGKDAITIANSDLLREQDRNVKQVAEDSGESIVGKRLMTEDGDNLGSIDDVLIDPATFLIVAYQVSGGLWHDLMRGQTDVPVEMVLNVGKDVVVVPSSVKQVVERTSGGLLGTFGVARTQISETLEDKEADYALGKTSGSDVTFDDGRVLVRQGETITEGHIQEALMSDKMHALAAAAGFHQAGEAWDTTKDKAGDAWDATKAKAAELGDKAQEKQGELLIGRTTGRPVVDDAGMTVVPEAKVVDQMDVDKARAAGKLNDLTTAVATKPKDALADRRPRSQTYLAPAPTALKPPADPAPSSTTVIHADHVVVQTGRDDVTVR